MVRTSIKGATNERQCRTRCDECGMKITGPRRVHRCLCGAKVSYR